MEATLYKDTVISRGFSYHYYFSPAADGKPYLLFLHGFPSTSADWRFQVPYLKGEGHGLVIPDMPGYGASSTGSTEPSMYTGKKVAQDLIELLDANKVDKVVAIAHDFGAYYASRLADYYQDRFIGFAFLSVGYWAPSPPVQYEDRLAMAEKLVGNPMFGYWEFFTSDDAESVIKSHPEPYLTVQYAADPKMWLYHYTPLGAMRSWLETGQTTEVGSYLSEEEYKEQADIFKAIGLAEPLAGYKMLKDNIDAEESAELLAKGEPAITKPVFFGGTVKDYVCLSDVMKAGTAKSCPNLTVKEYDSAHWVMFECREQLAKDIAEWVKGL